jgi:lipopolysaccharide transport system ATP-binding protein
MGSPNIIVEGLGKKFSKSFRSAIKYGLTDSVRRLVGLGKNPELRPGEFWALAGVDFSLYPGQALGVMGVNGSGKTTLLRILNGTYSPDKGKVTLRGRVGALIAAGAGFSPMLSGRENVYVSGSLLGLRSAEIRKRFDEIVAFAELEKFIDMPVRNYSSGMAVRLAFSVAVLGTPDILLVDEVLAVGDLSFQKKCYERIYSIKNDGCTILLVSHSPGAIWSVCDRGLVLDNGITNGIVGVEQACRDYEYNNNIQKGRQFTLSESTGKSTKSDEKVLSGSGEAFIVKLEVLNEGLEVISEIEFRQGFILRLHIVVEKKIVDCIFRIAVDSEMYKGIAILDSYEASSKLYTLEPGEYFVDIGVNHQNLRPGLYYFSSALVSKHIGVHLYFEHNLNSVTVKHPVEIFLYADFRAILHLESSYKLLKMI